MLGRPVHILFCVSGSVASVKAAEIHSRLLAFGEVKVVATQHSKTFAELPGSLLDEDEWSSWKCIGDPVLHIELRKWADIMLIAPLSANTLAKIAHGLADNLLTCVARAWDLDKPFLVAPAMNTHMWSHPFTATQLGSLRALGFTVIDPVVKTLACGDTGMGAMALVDTILAAVVDCLPRVHNSCSDICSQIGSSASMPPTAITTTSAPTVVAATESF